MFDLGRGADVVDFFLFLVDIPSVVFNVVCNVSIFAMCDISYNIFVTCC